MTDLLTRIGEALSRPAIQRSAVDDFYIALPFVAFLLLVAAISVICAAVSGGMGKRGRK